MLLLVEDDADDVELTRMGLGREGLRDEVVVARDGQEALALLARAHSRSLPLPDLILTDLKMPRVNGLELLRRLKGDARFRAIPAAVLTSSGDAGDRAEAERLGAAAYLRKPEDPSGYGHIASRLRELLAPT